MKAFILVILFSITLTAFIESTKRYNFTEKTYYWNGTDWTWEKTVKYVNSPNLIKAKKWTNTYKYKTEITELVIIWVDSPIIKKEEPDTIQNPITPKFKPLKQ